MGETVQWMEILVFIVIKSLGEGPESICLILHCVFLMLLIVAFQSIPEEQMPSVLVLQIFTEDGLCLLTKWQNNLENSSGHNFSKID